VYEKKLKDLVEYSNYDFITGALHSVEGIGMVLGKEVFADGEPMEIVEEYYSETLKMVEVSDIDILAHMGLFRRGMALAGLRHDFNEMQLWPETIDSILRVMIDRNIALELNTSGLRRREKMTYPITAILKRFRELGGTLVTIGSDTHREPYVFYGLNRGAELLLKSGFRKTYTFLDRVPQAFELT
jgi:histidinol-phosphatase (PHP family)